MKYLFKIIFIFILSFQLVNSYSNLVTKGTHKKCSITEIDDGDTFDLSCGDKEEKEYIPNVRLLGINTPDIGHCHYKESKDIIYSLKNRDLDVEFYGSDLCKDPYKGCRNLVRIVDIKSSIDINEKLVEKGFAFSWVKFSVVPAKVKLKYILAEKKAQEDILGFWGKCEVIYNDLGLKQDTGIPLEMTKEIAMN